MTATRPAAIQVAVDDFNKKGGILGHKVELVWADTKSNPTQAGNAATEVLEKGAKFLLASCDFDQGGAAAVVAQKRGVLVMSVCSGSPKWGPIGVGELAFSTGHAAQADGYLLAEWPIRAGAGRRPMCFAIPRSPIRVPSASLHPAVDGNRGQEGLARDR